MNVLCWCDETESAMGNLRRELPLGQQALLQERLIEAADIIRDLVGKLAYLEQHAKPVFTDNQWMYIALDHWRKAMEPLAAPQGDSVAVSVGDVAEKAFRAALVWHCLHPEATVEDAYIAGRVHAKAIGLQVRA